MTQNVTETSGHRINKTYKHKRNCVSGNSSVKQSIRYAAHGLYGSALQDTWDVMSSLHRDGRTNEALSPLSNFNTGTVSQVTIHLSI